MKNTFACLIVSSNFLESDLIASVAVFVKNTLAMTPNVTESASSKSTSMAEC